MNDMLSRWVGRLGEEYQKNKRNSLFIISINNTILNCNSKLSISIKNTYLYEEHLESFYHVKKEEYEPYAIHMKYTFFPDNTVNVNLSQLLLNEMNEKYIGSYWDYDDNLRMDYSLYNTSEEIDYETLSHIGNTLLEETEAVSKILKGEIQKGRITKSITSGCYITTAVCNNLGVNDNCYELNTFRDFRDNWLRFQNGGQALIEQYYDLAPNIVEAINRSKNTSTIYKQIWVQYLLPCLNYIESNQPEKCKSLYIKMVNQLASRFL